MCVFSAFEAERFRKTSCSTILQLLKSEIFRIFLGILTLLERRKIGVGGVVLVTRNIFSELGSGERGAVARENGIKLRLHRSKPTAW